MTDSISETIRLYNELITTTNSVDKDVIDKFDAILKQILDSYSYDIDNITDDMVLSAWRQSYNKETPLTEEILRSLQPGIIPLFLVRYIIPNHLTFKMSIPVEWKRFCNLYFCKIPKPKEQGILSRIYS